MPTGQQYSSVATQAQLTAGISNANTSCSVNTTSGFPATPFTGVFDIGTATQEIVDVTNVSGLTLTITRGVDGSAAQAHSNGATFTHSAIARDMREARSHIDASSSNDASGHSVHGLTVGSSVVGTTDVQTLTNKTLTSPTITGTANIANPNITGTVTGAAQYQAITAVPSAIGNPGFVVNGLSGQTADLIDVKNNGTTAFWVDAAGTAHDKPISTSVPALALDMPAATSAAIQTWSSNGVAQANVGNTGIFSGNAFANNGLTGAANAGRWVGNTTGGPPTSGTFLAGDFVNDMTYNVMWMCVTGGTPGTWKPMGTATIASTTVGSGGAASVTFSSIPNYFTNLEIKVSAISTVAANQDILQLQFNGDTAAHYEQGYIFIQNNNTVTGSHTGNNTSAACGFLWGNSSATVPGVAIIEIPGYSSTTLIKGFTFSSHASDTSALSWLIGSGGGGWNSTAAINSILLTPLTGNLAQHSVITLYGLP